MAIMFPPATESDLVRALRVQAELRNELHRITTFEQHYDASSIAGTRNEIWQREEMLGGGTFGVVHLESCTEGRSAGQLRAVKVIRKPQVGTPGSFDPAKELEALALFSQPMYRDYFVTATGWFENEISLMIAMEYHERGDLSKYGAPALPEPECCRIISQVLRGIDVMHSFGVTHRDLKPQNLLVVAPAPHWWIKIADFGTSKRALEYNTSMRSHAGSPAFMAPEVRGLLDDDSSDDSGNERPRQSYTNAVDIWSVGVICLLLLTGELEFSDASKPRRYCRGKSGLPLALFEGNRTSQEGLAFTTDLLCPWPGKRPDAKTALQHAWIASRQYQGSTEPVTATKISKTVASASWSTRESGGEHRWLSPSSVTNGSTILPAV